MEYYLDLSDIEALIALLILAFAAYFALVQGSESKGRFLIWLGRIAQNTYNLVESSSDKGGKEWIKDLESPESKIWVAAQQQSFRSYKQKYLSGEARDRLRKRYCELSGDDNTIYEPVERGRYIFYTRQFNTTFGHSLFVYDQHKDTTCTLIDARELAPAALGGLWVSPDGCHCAYTIRGGKSPRTHPMATTDRNHGVLLPSALHGETVELRIIDVTNGHHYIDQLTVRGLGGIQWRGQGFFYNTAIRRREYFGKHSGETDVLEDSMGNNIYYHALGRHQVC